MKFEKNDHYFTLAVYTLVTALIFVAVTIGIWHYQAVTLFIKKLLVGIWVLLMPLLLGIIIAYLLDPIVSFYHRKCQSTHFKKWNIHGGIQAKKEKMAKKSSHRTLATLLAYLTLLALVGLFVLIIVTNMKEVLGSASIRNIRQSMDRYIRYFENMLMQVAQVAENLPVGLNKVEMVQRIYGELNAIFNLISAKFLYYIKAIGLNAMNIVLAFVIAFYLLQDKESVLSFWRKTLKTVFHKKASDNLRSLGRDVDSVFSGYIRGQLLDTVIIAVLTSLALTLIRLDFAVIIGLVAGLFNLIPYFGPVVGFILAGLIGLLDPNPMKAVYGVIALMIIQQLDGWIIVPKVVGESVKLHPVVVLLAVVIGGNLFGLLGMLLGVPIAAFIRVLLLRYVQLFDTNKK
ncbi:hypothetical protein CS063_05260 [Sporanaerobium hydrogeniformans]|uniref:Uncharacterized protein n=1 Tax=Sporanaerobium hydrogeniformans TaxID=3072179 RepID=A0AC61DDR6_9FIRM|nr:AI-2E family transporter [Sporanaerobium hydrogeniformans]PHV71459.1 hypothetical protein CS063_05260 [Sporanaerobium hydrogeniformans]